MKLEAKKNQISQEVSNIDQKIRDLEAEKDELLNDLYYLQCTGFVKCSTTGKKAINHRK